MDFDISGANDIGIGLIAIGVILLFLILFGCIAAIRQSESMILAVITHILLNITNFSSHLNMVFPSF